MSESADRPTAWTAMEKRLLDAGVKNLKEFGYPDCTTANILTDYVYRQFFQSMLEHSKGHGRESDRAVDSLLVALSSGSEPWESDGSSEKTTTTTI